MKHPRAFLEFLQASRFDSPELASRTFIDAAAAFGSSQHSDSVPSSSLMDERLKFDQNLALRRKAHGNARDSGKPSVALYTRQFAARWPKVVCASAIIAALRNPIRSLRVIGCAATWLRSRPIIHWRAALCNQKPGVPADAHFTAILRRRINTLEQKLMAESLAPFETRRIEPLCGQGRSPPSR